MNWGLRIAAVLSLVLILAVAPTGAQDSGTIVGWGYNNYGQCNLPVPNTAFVAVGAGHYHSLGLRADGSIVAWGHNYHEQCIVPVPNSGFVAVAGGAAPSVLIRIRPGHTLGGIAEPRSAMLRSGIESLTAVPAVPPRDHELGERHGLTRWFRATLALDADLEIVMRTLRDLPGVERVELDGPATLAATFPNDPYFWNLWALHNTGQSGGTPDADIDAPEAWDLHTGNDSAIVAVIDTGIATHPDLQFIPGWNTVDNNANTHDGNGHGTHVAGTVGARGNNGVGVVGVSWGVTLMPVKCIDDGGGGSESTIAAGILWAADHGADIANLSLTTYQGTAFLAGAVAYAHDLGLVLVAAVGTTQSQGIAYPARFPQCLAVGTTDHNDQTTYFSVYGPEIDLVAPGVNILSTHLNNNYAMYSGTSMSTAYVSGLAALLKSYSPTLVNTQIEQILKDTADDRGPAGWDEHYGWGRINALGALQHADPHGDLNCDGTIDFDDINPFVLALSNPTAYQAAYPNCNILNGDCDFDGDVDFDDINPFVALLGG
jgi:subtilisin family serine protease